MQFAGQQTHQNIIWPLQTAKRTICNYLVATWRDSRNADQPRPIKETQINQSQIINQ